MAAMAKVVAVVAGTAEEAVEEMGTVAAATRLLHHPHTPRVRRSHLHATAPALGSAL